MLRDHREVAVNRGGWRRLPCISPAIRLAACLSGASSSHERVTEAINTLTQANELKYSSPDVSDVTFEGIDDTALLGEWRYRQRNLTDSS